MQPTFLPDYMNVPVQWVMTPNGPMQMPFYSEMPQQTMVYASSQPCQYVADFSYPPPIYSQPVQSNQIPYQPQMSSHSNYKKQMPMERKKPSPVYVSGKTLVRLAEACLVITHPMHLFSSLARRSHRPSNRRALRRDC